MTNEEKFEIEQKKLNILIEKHNLDLSHKDVLAQSQKVDELHNEIQTKN